MAIRSIYIESPLIGKMTQGSIINGCISEDFPNEEVYGFIITPRCDLEHQGKVNTVHYIPAVPFELWFDVIARPIIKDLWQKDNKSKLNNLFKGSKLGDEVMETGLSYEQLNQLCNLKISKKTIKDEIKQLLDAYFNKNPDYFDLFLLDGEGKPKNKHKLIEYLSRLEGNGIPAYYAIEGWDEYGKNKHLVLMLRDVRRLQFETAMQIKNGVYENMLGIKDTLKDDLFLNNMPKHFYWVQAQIASPFVEHIMQAFVYNFSRIGVEDRPGNTVDIMFNAIKNSIQ